jgi:hypothetical protein
MWRLQTWEVAKLLKSGMVNVALVWSLSSDSLNEVSRQARLNRYTGECCNMKLQMRKETIWQTHTTIFHELKEVLTPSRESLLVALANRAWRGKIPCDGNSVFALPETDTDICILQLLAQTQVGNCPKNKFQLSTMLLVYHEVYSSKKVSRLC